MKEDNLKLTFNEILWLKACCEFHRCNTPSTVNYVDIQTKLSVMMDNAW